MKNEADKSRMKTTGNSTERRGNTSKNSEIETYLRAHYAFRYNTVLGRTEYRSSKDASNLAKLLHTPPFELRRLSTSPKFYI